MSIVGDIKDIAEVLQKADNIELYKQVLNLQADAMKILDDNRELKEKVHDLEEKLKIQEDVEFKDNAYWKKSDDDGPFCVPCWDGKGQLMRMIDDEGNVSCPSRECDYTYQTEERKRRDQEAAERISRLNRDSYDRF